MIKEAKTNNIELVLVSLDLPDFYSSKMDAFILQRNYTGNTLFWLNETNADLFCPRIDKSWTGSIPGTLLLNNAKGYRKFIGQAMSEAEIKSAFSEPEQVISLSFNTTTYRATFRHAHLFSGKHLIDGFF